MEGGFYATSSTCFVARNVAPFIQRGNNRSACFYTAEDYLFYLAVLAEQAKKHGCAVHAWCLMTNHVHLLITPGSPESTGLMMKKRKRGEIYLFRK